MFLLITSLLISMVAAVWVWIISRKDPAGRPWLTGLCLVILLALPVLAQLPKMYLELGAGIATVGSGATTLHYWRWLSWGVTAGAVLMFIRLWHRYWLLNRWVSDSSPTTHESWYHCLQECQSLIPLKRLPEIRMKKGLLSPVVTGFWRPVILMPMSSELWGKKVRKMAILHEMGHVQRGDIWWRLMADICVAVHWYNPMVHWMRSQLFSQCEYACDARIIAAGVDKRSYIGALCDVVEAAQGECPRRPLGLVSMADHAPLTSRVDRLLKKDKVDRFWWAVIAAAFTLSTALGLTLMRPSQGDADDESGIRSALLDEVDLRHSANPFPGN